MLNHNLRTLLGLLVKVLLSGALLIHANAASAYDTKSYVGISGGFAFLDYEERDYVLQEDSAEAYELTVGWDIGHRWSLELNWADLGDFEYQSGSSLRSIDIVAFRVNGVFYLFNTRGFEGLQERTGFSGFVKFGAGRMHSRRIFSNFGSDLDDDFISLGFGLEASLNPHTYLRFQVHTFDDVLAYGSASIMWRWGRATSGGGY